MMAPLPHPNPSGDRPDLPRVRLEVRTGAGRVLTHEFGGDEFLIGAAAGCDLRLPSTGAPPVAVQLTRKPDGVRVRRVAAGLPVRLNDALLPAGTTTAVQNADTLSFGGLTVALLITPPAHAPGPQPVYVSPRFVSLDDAPAPPPPPDLKPNAPPAPAPPAAAVAPDLSDERHALAEWKRALDREEADRRAVWSARDAELIARHRALDRQAAELEADQRLWHERRTAIEQERADRHAAEVAAQEAELARTRTALTALRQQWHDECNRHRAELVAQGERLRTDRAALESDRADFESRERELRDDRARTAAEGQELARQRDLFAADRDVFEKARDTFDAHRAAETDRLANWEADLTARAAEVERRAELLDAARDQFEAERAGFRDELARFERRAAALDEGERDLAARTRDAAVQFDQLKRDAAELEETVRLVGLEQERLRADAERLDRQKGELDARSAALAERAGQIEAQQAVVAVFRSKLDRGREDMQREAWQLAAARVREDESQAELRKRIQEAEELRASLSAVRADADQERRRLDERDSLLAAGLAEIGAQREALAAESRRVQEREAELDARAAEFAEQAGTLKGRVAQALDLQSRLEADRVAIRERESALAQSEGARLALQEQLRRRAEDLNARAKSLDDVARQLATDRAALGAARGAVETARQTLDDDLTARRQELDVRAAAVERRGAEFAEKEQALARQVARLKDVGAAVAAERKSLAEARAACEDERARLDRFRAQVVTDFDALRARAPELDDQAKLALDRLGAARDMLRGHLSELHEFARTSRGDLEAARTQVRQEAERLREQHEALARARDEHRLAVTAFRQQLIEWQGTVADIRRQLASSENRIDAKTVAAADATRQLAEETDRLRREREELTARRTEMERHLSDLREWYRKKLRELARTNARDEGKDLKLHEPGTPADGSAPVPRPPAALPSGRVVPDELEPGDRQLGELLKSLGLVDADTLTALWAEAARQRRTLRQVLLASGAVTLYQLALIEAGNLDALVLGRFRVIDRLRVSPKEAIYRVFDPKRAEKLALRPAGEAPSALTGGDRTGIYLLRHLGESEMADAVHPDEFRQRFYAARDAAHPNLAGVAEVLDINGRPAALLEWLTGLFSADWPAFATHPGCWVRLATMAAGAIDAAHRVGLVHGRLTSEAFLLTPEGVLKVTGFGEPPWLGTAPTAPTETSPAADLRALGQVLFGWSQLAGKKRAPRAKAFPEALWGVVRRLEADAEPPMADTVAAAQPYQSAGELLADLQRIARETPFSDDAWEKLLKHVADNAPDSPAGLKKAG